MLILIKMLSTSTKRSRTSPTLEKSKSFRCDWNGKDVKLEPEGNHSPSFVVTLAELNAFFSLLDDSSIYEFLKYDKHCKLADKYLLAMVFAYFKRANFKRREFTRTNFYVALRLAHDMEEDDDDLKNEILYWATGGKWLYYKAKFLALRDMLWRRMNYRGVVSCAFCNELMSLVPNRAWQRHRSVHYAGAFRWYDKYSGIYFRNCHPCTPLHKRHNLVQNAVNSEEMTNSQISNDFKDEETDRLIFSEEE